MKVGLIRHFKVVLHSNRDRWMSSRDYQAWLDAYDTAEIQPNHLMLSQADWGLCYCSDLYRAQKTAQFIYSGPIVVTSLLREIPLRPVLNTRLHLPFGMWDMLGRIAWYNSRPSQAETRQQTLARVHKVISLLEAKKDVNTLIVSHGGFMLFLRREMERHGFSGQPFTQAENGRLYIFERN